MGEQRTQLERPAHPMVGWIAVIPLPNPDAERPEATAHNLETPFGMFRVLDVFRSPGMAAAVVMEIGATGHGDDADLLVPYKEGCTVFYTEGYAVKIGDYTFVPMERVLAWQEAPDG